MSLALSSVKFINVDYLNRILYFSFNCPHEAKWTRSRRNPYFKIMKVLGIEPATSWSVVRHAESLVHNNGNFRSSNFPFFTQKFMKTKFYRNLHRCYFIAQIEPPIERVAAIILRMYLKSSLVCVASAGILTMEVKVALLSNLLIFCDSDCQLR